MTRPADPREFYPPDAVSAKISGSVFIEARVSTDGHAHRSIAWYSVPEGIFESAGRDVARSTGYSPKEIHGAAQPCSVRYRAKFRVKSPADDRVTEAYHQTKVLAAAGDPVAQLYYGLLMFDREDRISVADRPLDWYLKAAQAGIPYAQYLVGVELVDLDRDGTDEEKAREIAKGLTWLKLSAANGRAEARFALADYQLVTHPEAVSDAAVFAWLEDAAVAKHRDATLYLGALLAASPDATRRNPARALELVDLTKRDFDSDPTALEVVAAAHAQLKQFEDAQSLQKRAIRTAMQLKWDVAPLQARLAKYQSGAPWTGNLLDP
jgi:hypothetical protein